jgi:hypothetical protein
MSVVFSFVALLFLGVNHQLDSAVSTACFCALAAMEAHRKLVFTDRTVQQRTILFVSSSTFFEEGNPAGVRATELPVLWWVEHLSAALARNRWSPALKALLVTADLADVLLSATTSHPLTARTRLLVLDDMRSAPFNQTLCHRSPD